MKKVYSIVVALVLLAVATVPALAAPPEFLSFDFRDGPYLIADCGDFVVKVEGDTHVDVKLFYDQEGNLIRANSHWAWDSEYYTVPDTGKRAYGHDEMNWVEQAVDGEWQIKQTGMALKLVVPGYGNLLIDAGLIVWDENFNVIRYAGQHPWNLGTGDFTKVCAYFAP